MPLPDSFLQELKSRCDITDVVSSYVTLKRRGRNYVGLCPFHNEKTPSFNIYPENGSFYCFGCNVGGDVITFIRRIENLDYMEAVRLLAQRAGLTVPENAVDDSMANLRRRVLEVNRETARFYHTVLLSPQGKAGLDYFTRRGLSPSTIRHFGLGFAPEGRFELVNHLRKKGFSKEEMVQANVAFLSRNGYPVDRFTARAMFPIIDLRGNVVAFGGRILTNEKPKYINTSDTPVYHKSSGLFAMNFAKNENSDTLILAEGYMDVIALHQAGFRTAIASLGTALTSEQARILARYAKEVIICYDSDEAGQRAASRAIPILRQTGLNVRVMTVPGNKDPDEFMRTYGKDGPARFKALIESSGNDVDYRLSKIRAGCDLNTPDGRVRYVTQAAELLGGMDNQIEREVYASRLAEEIGIDKSAVLAQAAKSARRSAKRIREQQFREQTRQMSGATDTVNTEKQDHLRAANAEETIIAYLFCHPDGAEFCRQRLKPEDFVTTFNRRVYNAVLSKMLYSASVSLADFSGEMTEDELSAVARILARYSEIPPTREDAAACIRVIRTASGKPDAASAREADPQELSKYIESLKNQKK